MTVEASGSGIAQQIRWVQHANVNTPHLNESVSFFQEAVGLTAPWAIGPVERRDGSSFGLPNRSVRFHGHAMVDERATRSPMVDLLEWIAPRTTAANRPIDHFGFTSLIFTVTPEQRQALAGRANAVELDASECRSLSGSPSIAIREPGGTQIEVFSADVARFAGIRLLCSDLGRPA